MTELTIDDIRRARETIQQYKPDERYVYIIPRWVYDDQDAATRLMIDNSETIHVGNIAPMDSSYVIDTEWSGVPEVMS